MIELSEKEIKEIFASANKVQNEDLLEFSIMLSGKCKIGNYIFPAPALGTYLLLSQWESPFLSNEFFVKTAPRKKPVKVSDFYTALYILKNGKKAARFLMEERTENLFRKKARHRNGYKDKFQKELKSFALQYPFSDERKAAEELLKILSLHSAEDMLPDAYFFEETSAGGEEIFSGENHYAVWMENIARSIFFVQKRLPALSPEDILWKMPYSSFGFLFVCEARKNNVPGIGKEEISRKLWKLFSQKLEEKKGSKK